MVLLNWQALILLLSGNRLVNLAVVYLNLPIMEGKNAVNRLIRRMDVT
jgi:hypothetical protein